MAGSPNRWSGSPNRWSGSPNRWSGSPNRWSGSPNRWSGSPNRWSGSPNRWSGSPNRWSGSPNRWSGSSNRWSGSPNRWSGYSNRRAFLAAGMTGNGIFLTILASRDSFGGGRRITWTAGNQISSRCRTRRRLGINFNVKVAARQKLPTSGTARLPPNRVRLNLGLGRRSACDDPQLPPQHARTIGGS